MFDKTSSSELQQKMKMVSNPTSTENDHFVSNERKIKNKNKKN
jgi:hypothetical protein